MHAPSVRLFWSSLALALVLLGLSAGTARAYLIDANDANTVDPGTVEMEVQPVGFYRTYGDDAERYLLTPSVMFYVGLTEGFDVILIGRGYLLLGSDGGVGNGAYSFTETGGFVRAMLRDGSYWGEDSGPSLTLQLGVYLPTTRDPEVDTLGGSAALLLSQSWDAVDLHANAQLDFAAGYGDFFGSLVLEGDTRWPVRPTAEVYVSADLSANEVSVSGLIGVMADVSDRFQVSTGVRYAGGSAGRELEWRLSTWYVLGGRRDEGRPAPDMSNGAW